MRSALLLPVVATLFGVSLATPVAKPFGKPVPFFGKRNEPWLMSRQTAAINTDPGSERNINIKQPLTTIFPKKDEADAPYDLTEEQMRAPIYFPPTYTYGVKQPLLLVSGTGTNAPQSFQGNYQIYFKNATYVDPVWINFPNAMLNDAQENAEMVAYAVNYISGVSQGRNVKVLTWSQGGLVTQWALKYWPSIRTVVDDFVAIAPDFKGTTWAITQACNFLPCTPNSFQQMAGSTFVKTLAADDGDSAYVPTTTVFSADDEIVQPSSGEASSSWIKDVRGVGVSNNEVQKICSQPGDGAGGSWSHEGLLYNNLAVNLAIDALKNEGPANLARLGNLTAVCKPLAYTGVGPENAWAGQVGLWISAANLFGGGPTGARYTSEPPLKAYAKLTAKC